MVALGRVRDPMSRERNGQTRMTTKATFSDREWEDIVTAPLATGLLAIAADRGGTVRESLAMGRYYAQTRESRPAGLLGEIVTSPPRPAPGEAPKSADEVRDDAPRRLRRAIAALERLATDDELVAYKQFVYGLVESVARAHKEGGFLGIGGTEISPPEQAVLDEIARIFDEVQNAP
jgi:hypothetical protein